MLSFTIAIDYTGSNGEPRLPGSLHYTGGTTPNQYEQSIQMVGQVIEPYDSDGLFPVYGFGGSLNKRGTSHCPVVAAVLLRCCSMSFNKVGMFLQADHNTVNFLI